MPLVDSLNVGADLPEESMQVDDLRRQGKDIGGIRK